MNLKYIFACFFTLGKDLGLPRELLMRHPFPIPGLAIRVLCAEEPYIERDYYETQAIVKIIVEYKQMVIQVSFEQVFVEVFVVHIIGMSNHNNSVFLETCTHYSC